MKVRMKKTIVLLCVSAFACVIAQEFVVKKTKKGPSRSKLQEQCCQEIASLLQELPPLLTQIAVMQELSMKHLCGFFEGDKTAFLESGDAKQLQQMHEQVQKMVAHIKTMNSDLAAHATKMRSFKT